MADIINLLPDHVANQIAAGEVVQRPASIIKELIENSIDAGSTKIQVIVKDGGKTLIQVIDNGCGMSATDARMCFERHATSKIQKATDLFDIQTMGFRGEAMASIVAVASVEMRTRKYGDEMGTYIKMSGSEVESQEPTQCPNGTNIMVKNMFYNIPARRKFLKSDAVEMSHITEEFCRVALAHPNVEMQLTHNNVELYNLSSSNTMNRILGVAGKTMSKCLLPIESETSVVKIKGYVGTPEYAKSKADQYFFVNNRFMKHPSFNKAVQKAYGQLLPAGKNPVYFIYLDVNPATIDINIHPTKTEIKFENESSIWPILQATVKESLGKFSVGPAIDFDNERPIEIPVFSKNDEVRPPEVHYTPNYNPFNTNTSAPTTRSVTFKSKIGSSNKDWEKLYAGFESHRGESNPLPTPDIAPTPLNINTETQENAPEQTLIPSAQTNNNGKFYQLKNRYILTNVKSGLMLIDQRRAHERIIYEELLAKSTDNEASQRLLFPERIDLSVKDGELFKQMIPELEGLGFEINDLGGNSYSFTALPNNFPEKNIKDWINSMLMLTGEDYVSIKESMRENIAAMMAQYLAIGSKALTQEEMNDINLRLFACQIPNFTPSGKPIINILNIEEIDSLFK